MRESFVERVRTGDCGESHGEGGWPERVHTESFERELCGESSHGELWRESRRRWLAREKRVGLWRELFSESRERVVLGDCSEE